MAPINTKNIHRSNKLMNHIYGESFKYNEMWIQGPGEEGKAAAEFISTMNPLGMLLNLVKDLQENLEKMETMMYFFVQMLMARLLKLRLMEIWIQDMALHQK